MKARIYVTLKEGVLDPQGKAVSRSLKELGFSEVEDVRIGRYIQVELAADAADKKVRVEEMCRKLLANPVMENYRIELDESGE